MSEAAADRELSQPSDQARRADLAEGTRAPPGSRRPPGAAAPPVTAGPPKSAGPAETTSPAEAARTGAAGPAPSTAPESRQPAAGEPPQPVGPEPSAEAKEGSWRHRHPLLRREVRWTITAVVLIFVVEYLLLPDLASARKSLNLLGRVSIGFLILALILEVAALLSYAELSRTVLAPDAPGRFRMFRINMSTLAVSHVLPGGTAPGAAVGYRLLLDSDVRGSTAAFGLATQGIGSAVVLNVLFLLALLVSIPLEGFNPLYGVAALLGLVLFALFGGAVVLLTRGRQGAVDRLCRLAGHLPFVEPETLRRAVINIADRLQVLLRDRRMLRRALLWAAANWLFDAASLWVFLYAYGARVLPIDLLVAYGLANILAVIPITPAGLGVVEGVLIPTLVGFGVARNIAILGVLTYRLVNFWLPIPTGGLSYLSLRFHRGSRHPRGGAADVAARPDAA